MKAHIALVLGSLAIACGSAAPVTNDDGGAGSGSDGGGGGGSGGVTINASLGMDIVDVRAKNEGPLTGRVLVKLDGHDASGATVDVNGKRLLPFVDSVLGEVKGMYVMDLADAPAVGPDLKLSISASAGGKSASISVDCPADLTVTTTPAAGAALGTSGSVTVSWSGDLWVNGPSLGFYDPTLSLRGFDDATKSFDALGQPSTAKLTRGATSGTVTTPSTDAPGYLLQLRVPGAFKLEAGSSAICYRAKRFLFAK